MIKINLLTVERQRAKKKLAFDPGQKLIAACSLLLVAAGRFIGWRYWSLDKESKRLDTEIAFGSACAGVTVVMVFVLQHTQRRAQSALQLKLDELVRATPRADDHLIGVEAAPDDELHDREQNHLDDHAAIRAGEN